MALQKQLHEYTQDELDEHVEFDIVRDNEHKTFKVLRILLTAYVPSLDSLFRFTGIKSVKLTGISPETFEIFLGWLRREHYGGDDNSVIMGMKRVWTKSGYVKGFEYDDLVGTEFYESDDPLMWRGGSRSQTSEYAEAAIDMYIFAITYEIPRLRQDAIDRLFWCHNNYIHALCGGHPLKYIGVGALQRAYKNTGPTDPIRSLLCESYCRHVHKDEQSLMALPKELLVHALRKAQNPDTCRGLLVPCDYHQHADEAEKAACEIRVWVYGSTDSDGDE